MSKAVQDHWHQVRQKVEVCLEDFFTKQLQQTDTRNTAGTQLWQLLANVTMVGGKRVRPYLVVLAYEGYGGTLNDDVITVGASWELLHQGLLIHDDIIDRDYLRHGQPNVAGQLRKLYRSVDNKNDRDHYANSGALLAGDVAISNVYQLVFASSLADDLKIAVCHIIGQAINAVGVGEMLDTEAVMQPLGTTNSTLIAELKTGSYSFVGPLQTGAILAGVKQTGLQQLHELGTALGIAFQLSDDLLGLFGDEKVTGKPNDSDVHEGKRTALLQYAFAAANKTDQTFITRVVGNAKATTKEVEQFRHIVIKTGAKNRVEQIVSDYLDKADELAGALVGTTPLFIERYSFLLKILRQRKA